MEDRLETADILPAVKERALTNLANTQIDDLLFVISVLGVAIAWFYLFRRMFLGESFKLTRLTIPSFFMCAYIILMSIPAVIWFYASVRDPMRYTFFLAMQSVLIAFPLGVLCANVLFINPGVPSRLVKQFLQAPLVKTSHDSYMFPFWVILVLASILIATVYIANSGYVPLLGALTAYGELPAQEVRSSMARESDPIHYGHALAGRFLLPFCFLYAYFTYYLYKGRWRLVFWITLLLAMFISLLSFDRTYPFSIPVFLALAIYFKNQNNELILMHRSPSILERHSPSKSKVRFVILTFAALALAMIVGGTISRTQYNQPLNFGLILETSLGFFVDRVLLDASYMAYVYFEEFNNSNKFLYGQSLHMLLSSILGVKFYPTISPSFVAELWLNFGWLGVLIGSAIIGCVLQVMQLHLFRMKSIPTLCLYIILLLNGAWIIYGHIFATMVISVYVAAIVVLMFLKKRDRSSVRPASCSLLNCT
jgi:oligosaccharide repeat unit polymerase